MLAVFARAADAVAAALQAQRALAAERWPTVEPLRVRMAIHTGDAQLRDECNYAGPVLNRCARLRDLAATGHSVAQVAREFGVGWHTAMGAVRDHGRPRVDHLSRLRMPKAIGLDETSFLAANSRHPTLLVTGFVDLDRHRLIDVVPGRSATAVSTWLRAKPERWLANIATAVIDPFSGYARGLAEGLGHALLVVDHFHAVRLANQALDDVRRRT